MAAGVAVAMALVAAFMFAVAAVRQNDAVAAVAPSGAGSERAPLVGPAQFRRLAASSAWLIGVGLTAVASVVHAVALFLAPVAVVQPVGVLSVPLAVVMAAWRTRRRPPAVVWAATVACLGAVGGFVLLAESRLADSPAPRFVDGVVAVAVTGSLVAALAWWASRRSRWLRCAGFAASGATAFGLVSALMRLIALHVTTGVNDLDDVGVWLPAVGIGIALVVGGWAVQQAHASGAPAVVVGCLTVVDPLVAVGLGISMLGEGVGTGPAAVFGLIGLAILGLGAALLLAERHPDVGTRAAPPATRGFAPASNAMDPR